MSIDNAKMHEQVVAQQALQRDLELARRMQRALLPSQPPQVPGYCFFDYYQAARQVGGDYYDYVQLPGGRFAVIVGDVAGKGVSAALLMARLSGDVRFSLASEADPAKAVQQDQRRLLPTHDWQDQFVTMIVAVVDPQHARADAGQRRPHGPALAPQRRQRRGNRRGSGRPAARRGRRTIEYESYTHAARAGRFRHDLHRRLQRSDERRPRALRPGAAEGAAQLARP